jgi:hypothetical protein
MKPMVALYVGLPFAALIGLALPAQCDEVRDFYIKTVHLDGNTSTKGDADHKPEAFPSAPLPDGGGLVLSKPDEDGKWRIRAFTFEPYADRGQSRRADQVAFCRGARNVARHSPRR